MEILAAVTARLSALGYTVTEADQRRHLITTLRKPRRP